MKIIDQSEKFKLLLDALLGHFDYLKKFNPILQVVTTPDSKAYGHFEVKDDQIYIKVNLYEISRDSKKNRTKKMRVWREYVQSMDLDFDIVNAFILVALHEFGHFEQYGYFKDRNEIRQFRSIVRVSKNTIHAAWDTFTLVKTLKTDTVGIDYRLDANEVYAQFFCMKNFPSVWKKLNNIVQLEEN
jgi:hypothetical protein